jgi:hypothetical protein
MKTAPTIRRYFVSVGNIEYHNKSLLFISQILGEYITPAEFEEFIDLRVGVGSCSIGGEISYTVRRIL